jgi:hypothetical protein
MADRDPNRVQPDKLEQGETHPARKDIKEQRAGPQDNQLSGQVEKGAHNQDMKGRNPQGNKEERWSR